MAISCQLYSQIDFMETVWQNSNHHQITIFYETILKIGKSILKHKAAPVDGTGKAEGYYIDVDSVI